MSLLVGIIALVSHLLVKVIVCLNVLVVRWVHGLRKTVLFAIHLKIVVKKSQILIRYMFD